MSCSAKAGCSGKYVGNRTKSLAVIFEIEKETIAPSCEPCPSLMCGLVPISSDRYLNSCQSYIANIFLKMERPIFVAVSSVVSGSGDEVRVVTNMNREPELNVLFNRAVGAGAGQGPSVERRLVISQSQHYRYSSIHGWTNTP